MSKKSVSRLYGLLLVLLAAVTIGASLSADVASADTGYEAAGTDLVRLPRPSMTTTTEGVPTTMSATTTTTTYGGVPTFGPPRPSPSPTTTTTSTTTTTRPPGFPPAPRPGPTTTTTTTTTDAPSPEVMERPDTVPVFLALVNEVRADLGRSQLTLDPELSAYARDWAEHLARTKVVQHSDFSSLIGTRWSNTGENIGFGGSEEWIVDWLVNSPPHYDTMTRFTYTHIGIGSWQDERGLLWTVHVYAKERSLIPRPRR